MNMIKVRFLDQVYDHIACLCCACDHYSMIKMKAIFIRNNDNDLFRIFFFEIRLSTCLYKSTFKKLPIRRYECSCLIFQLLRLRLGLIFQFEFFLSSSFFFLIFSSKKKPSNNGTPFLLYNKEYIT